MTSKLPSPGKGKPGGALIEERLTDRDVRVLTLLGVYGCVTADRIKAHFWKTTQESCIHYRRLALLKRWGFIESVVGDRAMTIGYRLTKKGRNVLRNGSKSPGSAINRRAYKTPFEHDQLLIDVRRILEKSPIICDFKAEAELRQNLHGGPEKLLHWESAPLVPDATFDLSTPSRKMRIAIELELSIKSRRRYARIFRNHLLSKDWQLVLYIAKDRPYRDQLMKILSEVKAKDVEIRVANQINGIYFCTLDDFLQRELSVPMTNGKKEISFAQIAQNLSART